MKKITTEEILQGFGMGYDCSQIVLRHFSTELGMDEKTALKISSAFGGGMWRGETCGAVTGALMVIGLKYGHSTPGDEAKGTMLAKKKEFEDAFSATQGSCICKDILGYNLAVKEEMDEIMKKNLLTEKCPHVVLSAILALEKIL